MSSRRPNFITERIDADNASGKYDGRVVTRFPPEPNGFLHIGHAKSICLNFGIAEDYGGQCNLRFDDTNPETEETIYVESIQADIAWLGFEWSGEVKFASGYFQQMYDYAEMLVEKGLAYVDSSTKEEIRERRGSFDEPGVDSPYRDRSVEENLDLLRRMKAGEFPDGAHVLRARIDMAAPNMLMRDPLLYRIKHAHHHRTGDDWCIYPMYDYAHCLEDAIEGVTHSICTLEFESNRELYDWVLDNLPVPYRPEQIEFARLALDYAMMSKRRLIKLVRDGHVAGWDDPRMPTLAGFRRRGVRPEAIREFCDMVGVAKNNSRVDLGKLEYCIREDLDHVAPRVMAVLRPLKVVITNYPEGEVETFDTPSWPHDVPKEGSRPVPFARELFVERTDFALDPPKKWHRLAPGREVRLRYAYFIRCEEVVRDEAGEVVELRCTYDPATRGGNAPDGRKVRGTLHWVSAAHAVRAEVRLYEQLFSHPAPLSEPDRDFLELLNPESLVTLTDARVEPSLADLPAGERVQFERHGYFVTDIVDSKPGALVFNRIVGLRDSWAKIRARAEPEGAEPASTPAEPKAARASSEPKRASRRTRAHEREDARAADPALAASYARYQAELGLAADVADLLTGEAALAGLFDAAVAAGGDPATVAKWVVHVVLGEIGDSGSAADLKLDGPALAAVVGMVEASRISTSAGKELVAHLAAEGGDPEALVVARGLEQVSDQDALAVAVQAVVTAHPDEAGRYASGEKRLFGFFMGALMRETGGSANPKLASGLLREHLDRLGA